jgi:hypothetical protein
MSAVRGAKQADANWRRRRDLAGYGPESFELFKEEQEPYNKALWRLTAGMRPPLNAPFGSASAQAGMEAREAYVEFFGTFGYHRSDMAKHFAAGFAHAASAAAWACEAERGQEGIWLQQGPWYARHRPGRACATLGNRRLRQAVTPAVLLAIATQIMRYR